MSGAHKIGDLVWAKMKGFSPWPGRVSVPTHELLKLPKKPYSQCIYFFGSNNYAWIEHNHIKSYNEFKEQFINSCKTVAFKEAVAEIEEYMQSPDKFGDIDGPKINAEEDFDKLKEVMARGGDASSQELSPDNKEKKKGTPKIRSGAFKRSSSVSSKSVVRKKMKTDQAQSYKNSVINDHSASKKFSLIHRPFILGPDTLPLDLENISVALLEKNIKASQKKFGFLGLGIMGSGIVKNIINSGHKVVIWNRTQAKCKDFEKIGAFLAVTPCDVMEEADITFSCVADPQAAKEMVFGNCGILHCSTMEGKAYVEMTSIDADTSQDILEAIRDKGGRYLEAQIQGSKTQAEEGTLILLAAGDRQLFDDCQSCFMAMSRNTFFLGDNVGSASKMNSVLQVVGGISLAGLAEGLALADRTGLSQIDLLDILSITPLASPYFLQKGRAMIESTYFTQEPLTHMQKDLKLALGLGDTLEQSLPLTATANEIYKHAKRLGYANHDAAAVYIPLRF